MSDTGSRASGALPLLLRLLIGFSVVGAFLGVAAVVVVHRTMTAFHAELLQNVDHARDPALLDMIASDQRILLLMMVMIVLVAAVNIAAAIVMLARPDRLRRMG